MSAPPTVAFAMALCRRFPVGLPRVKFPAVAVAGTALLLAAVVVTLAGGVVDAVAGKALTAFLRLTPPGCDPTAATIFEPAQQAASSSGVVCLGKVVKAF